MKARVFSLSSIKPKSEQFQHLEQALLLGDSVFPTASYNMRVPKKMKENNNGNMVN